MKVRTLVYLVIVLILINVAALATIVIQRVNRFDRPRGFDNYRGSERTSPPDFQLSDEERQAMERARADFAENVKPIVDSLSNVRRALFDELKLEKPDSAIVNEEIETLGALQTRIQKRMINRFLSDRDIMKPEHRERFLQMIEQRTRGGRFWGEGRPGDQDHRHGYRRGH
jgi:uncharacterized membrane protein